jgi:hypothetical protein
LGGKMQFIWCRRLRVWIIDVLFHRDWLIISGPFGGPLV